MMLTCFVHVYLVFLLLFGVLLINSQHCFGDEFGVQYLSDFFGTLIGVFLNMTNLFGIITIIDKILQSIW